MPFSSQPIATSVVPYGDETVRVVIVREQIGALLAYVAQGLERDIAAQGRSPDEALSSLRRVAKADHCFSTKHNTEVPAAPKAIFDLFDASNDRTEA